MSSAAVSNLVKPHFFKATGKPNEELVCYVAGFGTKIKSYRPAITVLQKMGFDVLAFDYDRAILEAGDPKYLINAIDEIVRQTTKRSQNYSQTICMGVSLGAFIGYSSQKWIPNAYVGAYAAGGVEMTSRIFTLRIFKTTAKAFTDNGYNAAKLKKAWQNLDVEPTHVEFPPDKSFIAFEGTADRIVPYKEAKRNIKNWQAHGVRVKMYTVRGRGHLLTAVYFIRHTREIVTKAKQYHHASAKIT